MAWTAPMTAIATAAFTAAQFNTYVRDNLVQTAPAKATTAGGIFVATGTNAIAERIPTAATVSTSQTTASTSYANLSTSGPTVTVTTGAQAIVMWSAFTQNSTSGASNAIAFEISGATTHSASDVDATRFQAASNSDFERSSGLAFVSLTPGSNTFQMKYRVSGGTGTFANRHLCVIPL